MFPSFINGLATRFRLFQKYCKQYKEFAHYSRPFDKYRIIIVSRHLHDHQFPPIEWPLVCSWAHSTSLAVGFESWHLCSLRGRFLANTGPVASWIYPPELDSLRFSRPGDCSIAEVCLHDVDCHDILNQSICELVGVLPWGFARDSHWVRDAYTSLGGTWFFGIRTVCVMDI